MEARAVSRWLYAQLSSAPAVRALVGTRLYDTLAPQQSPDEVPELPCVIWNLSSGGALAAAGADRRVLVELRMAIQAYALGGGYGEADAVAAAVDDALAGAAGSVSIGGRDYWIATAQQESPVRTLDLEDGQRVHRVGGIYLVLAHGLP